MRKKIDIKGKKFGDLLVLEKTKTEKSHRFWKVYDLKKKELRIVREDRIVRNPSYKVWDNMVQRATNPNFTGSKYYYGRGINIEDPRWYAFENFLEDMGDKPNGLTLDRIDNEKGYYKENCRWTTQKIQQNNKRKRGKENG